MYEMKLNEKVYALYVLQYGKLGCMETKKQEGQKTVVQQQLEAHIPKVFSEYSISTEYNES